MCRDQSQNLHVFIHLGFFTPHARIPQKWVSVLLWKSKTAGVNPAAFIVSALIF
jgi:hypothetical protein